MAARYRASSATGSIHVSVVTEAELSYGASRLGKFRRDHLLEEIAIFVDGLSSVVAVSRPIAAAWALLKREAEIRGRPIASNDLWIAATAVAHDMILVAHDKDFENIPDLKLEDWVA